MDRIRRDFVIGITGHRNLPKEKIPAIAQKAQDFFAGMKAEHGSVMVLSSLAEGADMLCAKAALDLQLRLVVPLPMAADEYRKDFSDAAGFDRLLSEADTVFTVGPVLPGLPRGFYYRQAGIYVAKNCDLLLAVWDGARCDTRDGAGTWETIKLAREFEKPVEMIEF